MIAVWEDILTLLKFRLADRLVHQGLAGSVQTSGILIFYWIPLSESLMLFSRNS
jgi:hypothetical protein